MPIPKKITTIEAREVRNRLLDQNSITGSIQRDVEIAEGVIENLAPWLRRIKANAKKARDISTELQHKVRGEDE